LCEACLAALGLLLGSRIQRSSSNPVLARARLSFLTASGWDVHLAALGLLLGSAFQASPSNPALRILLRAFERA